MSISVQENQWRLSGDIVMDNANALLEESNALVVFEGLQVDFSAVTDVDTAALSLMMAWQRRAASTGKKIIFTNVPDNLMSLAQLYGVTAFIPLAAN